MSMVVCIQKGGYIVDFTYEWDGEEKIREKIEKRTVKRCGVRKADYLISLFGGGVG